MNAVDKSVNEDCCWARCKDKATTTIKDKPVCNGLICQSLLKWGFSPE